VLPFTPLAAILSFTPIAWTLLAAIAGIVVLYVAGVELTKHFFYKAYPKSA
jgi:hypothetical protein